MATTATDRAELCRLCASRDHARTDIFGSEGKNRQLAEKIQACLPFSVSESDRLPKCVCRRCVYNLENFYDFRTACVNAVEILSRCLEGRESPARWTVLIPEAPVVNPNAALGTPPRYHSDPESNDEESYELDMETNPSDFLELTATVEADEEERNKNNQTDEVPKEYRREEFEKRITTTNQRHSVYVCSLCGKAFSSKGHLSLHARIHVGVPVGEVLGEKVLTDDHTAYRRPYQCDLCSKSYSTAKHRWGHVSTSHRGHPAVTCGYCSRIYSTRTNLEEHIKSRHGVIREYANEYANVYANECNNEYGKDFEKKINESSDEEMEEMEEEVVEGGEENREFRSAEAKLAKNPQLTILKQALTKPEGLKRELEGKSRTESRPRKLRRTDGWQYPVCPKPYFCVLCKKAFALKSSLSRHVLTLHARPTPDYQPPTPHLDAEESTSNSNSNLEIELELDLEEPEVPLEPEDGSLFVCEVCARAFSDRASLWLHLRASHREMAAFACGLCLKICEDNGKLLEHVGEVHGGRKMMVSEQRRYSCTICGRQHDSRKKLIGHVSIHNVDPGFDPANFVQLNSNFYDEANDGQKTQRQFLQGRCGSLEGDDRTGRLVDCYICCKSFPNEDHLIRHQRNAHKPEQSQGTESVGYGNRAQYHLFFVCELCGSSHPSKWERWLHVSQRHEDEPEIKCDREDCGKIFATRSLRASHVQHHQLQGSSPNTCEVCGKLWGSRVDYWKHVMGVHAETVPLVCGVCLKVFPDVPSLSSHVRTRHWPLNTGDFCCDICGRPYSNRSKMSRHRKIHGLINESKTKLKSCTKSKNVLESISNGHVEIRESPKPKETFFGLEDEEDEDERDLEDVSRILNTNPHTRHSSKDPETNLHELYGSANPNSKFDGVRSSLKTELDEDPGILGHSSDPGHVSRILAPNSDTRHSSKNPETNLHELYASVNLNSKFDRVCRSPKTELDEDPGILGHSSHPRHVSRILAPGSGPRHSSKDPETNMHELHGPANPNSKFDGVRRSLSTDLDEDPGFRDHSSDPGHVSRILDTNPDTRHSSKDPENNLDELYASANPNSKFDGVSRHFKTEFVSTNDNSNFDEVCRSFTTNYEEVSGNLNPNSDYESNNSNPNSEYSNRSSPSPNLNSNLNSNSNFNSEFRSELNRNSGRNERDSNPNTNQTQNSEYDSLNRPNPNANQSLDYSSSSSSLNRLNATRNLGYSSSSPNRLNLHENRNATQNLECNSLNRLSPRENPSKAKHLDYSLSRNHLNPKRTQNRDYSSSLNRLSLHKNQNRTQNPDYGTSTSSLNRLNPTQPQNLDYNSPLNRLNPTQPQNLNCNTSTSPLSRPNLQRHLDSSSTSPLNRTNPNKPRNPDYSSSTSPLNPNKPQNLGYNSSTSSLNPGKTQKLGYNTSTSPPNRPNLQRYQNTPENPEYSSSTSPLNPSKTQNLCYNSSTSPQNPNKTQKLGYSSSTSPQNRPSFQRHLDASSTLPLNPNKTQKLGYNTSSSPLNPNKTQKLGYSSSTSPQNRPSLQRHRRLSHGLFTCDLCDKSYGRTSHLWKHVNRVHKGRPEVTCGHCGKTSASRDHLRAHVAKIHRYSPDLPLTNPTNLSNPTNPSNPENLGLYRCEKCSKGFHKRYLLRRHAKGCQNYRKDPSALLTRCRACERIFKDRASLQKHVENHHSCYECHLCGERVVSKLGIMRHNRIRHMDHPDLRCELAGCGKLMRTKGDLEQHRKEHRYLHGSNPNVCDYCGDTVDSKLRLKMHVLSLHRNEIGVSCGVCLIPMTNPRDLKRHVEMEHPRTIEKPNTCRVCGKQYASKWKAYDHTNKCHGKVFLTCKQCLSVFTTENEIREHYSIEHGVPNLESHEHNLENHERDLGRHAHNLEAGEEIGTHGGNNANNHGIVDDDWENSVNSVNSGNSGNSVGFNVPDFNLFEDLKMRLDMQQRREIGTSLESTPRKATPKAAPKETSKEMPKDPRNPRKDPRKDSRKDSRKVYDEETNTECCCEVCGKRWPAKKHLWQHLIRFHRKEAAVTCGVCLKLCGGYEGLEMHLRDAHGEVLGKEGNNFTCKICGRYHNARSKLLLHMGIHIGIVDRTNDCLNNCSNNYANNCENNCENNCDNNCSNNCENNCENNYENNCENNYENNCENNYENNCENNYENNCENNYENNCENNYENNCENNYENNCENNYENNCENNYENNCENNYENNYENSECSYETENDEPTDDEGPPVLTPMVPIQSYSTKNIEKKKKKKKKKEKCIEKKNKESTIEQKNKEESIGEHEEGNVEKENKETKIEKKKNEEENVGMKKEDGVEKKKEEIIEKKSREIPMLLKIEGYGRIKEEEEQQLEELPEKLLEEEEEELPEGQLEEEEEEELREEQLEDEEEEDLHEVEVVEEEDEELREVALVEEEEELQEETEDEEEDVRDKQLEEEESEEDTEEEEEEDVQNKQLDEEEGQQQLQLQQLEEEETEEEQQQQLQLQQMQLQQLEEEETEDEEEEQLQLKQMQLQQLDEEEDEENNTARFQGQQLQQMEDLQQLQQSEEETEDEEYYRSEDYESEEENEEENEENEENDGNLDHEEENEAYPETESDE